MDLEEKGIHEKIQEFIKNDEILHLSGGVSMMNGFKERIEKEIKSEKFHLENSTQRNFSSFLGGQVFSYLDLFLKDSISKFQYDENGFNNILF